MTIETESINKLPIKDIPQPVPTIGIPDELTGLQYSRTLRDFLDIFEEHGFVVRRGGTFNPANPFEVMMTDGRHSIVEAYADAALSGGIDLPARFSPTEALHNDRPVVAKNIRSNRGEGKYLLETLDQKARFVTLLELIRISRLEKVLDAPSPLATVAALSERVKAAESIDSFYDRDRTGHWVFEEFIETPGAFFTSFRITVDALGNIYYGQVARSQNRKEEDVLLDHPGNENNRVSQQVQNPESPFYLGSRKIISNIMAGGTPILLNGNRPSQTQDVEVLKALGIDPQNPRIPQELLEPSRRIGIFSRKDFPFLGVDFMQRTDGSFVFLEVNSGPQINPEGIGLPKDISGKSAWLAMTRIIAAKIRDSHRQEAFARIS